MILRVVRLEDIAGEVVLKIAPDKVSMVRVVLRVGIFDQEIWSLDAEIMRAISFE